MVSENRVCNTLQLQGRRSGGRVDGLGAADNMVAGLQRMLIQKSPF